MNYINTSHHVFQKYILIYYHYMLITFNLYKNSKYRFNIWYGALSTGHNHPYKINSKESIYKYVHLPQQVFKTHPIK